MCSLFNLFLFQRESGWRSGHQSRTHFYDPGSNPGLRTLAEICLSQSDADGFSPDTLVFLPLQIQLSRQDLSRQAIKH